MSNLEWAPPLWCNLTVERFLSLTDPSLNVFRAIICVYGKYFKTYPIPFKSTGARNIEYSLGYLFPD